MPGSVEGPASEPPAAPSSGSRSAARPADRLRKLTAVAGRVAGRAACCPAVWLSLLAALFYSFLAVQRVDQHVAGSYDYGVIFQVVHGWAFHFYPSEPLQGPNQNEWDDHFAPILMLLAPLLRIRDTPAVLGVAQAFLICSAGIPIYYAVRRMQGATVATIAVVFYLTSIEVQGAIGFDIHENMFQPLLIALAIERALAGKWTAATIFVGLNLFSYEDVGIMAVLFGLWAAWHRKWRHAAVLCVVGPLIVVLFTAVIVPEWGRDVANYQLRHFDYAKTLHASSAGQAFKSMVEHPVHLLRLMVDNPVKRQTWFLLLAPVGFLCLLSPISLLGSSTVVLLMASGNTTHWSTNYHFYLQIAPIIVIGAADGLNRLGRFVRRLWQWYSHRAGRGLPERLEVLGRPPAWRATAIVLAFLSLAYTVHLQTAPKIKPNLSAWVYLDRGYRRPASAVAAINKLAALVPPDQKVYVTNDIGTVLVAQDTEQIDPVYATYVLFDTGSVWTPKDFAQTLVKQGFHQTASDGDVFLYAR